MRILIEVPTYDGRISQATSESLWRMDLCGHDVDYKPRSGYGCAMARNRIAADALNAHYDYVLMVDNDIALPRDALRNLLEHDVDFVMGYYLNRYSRGESRFTTVYKPAWNWQMYEMGELREKREGGEHLIRVKGGGLGCALIRTSVFERVEFPWFEWVDQAREKMDVADAYESRDAFVSGGEDITFCIRCENAGIAIHADTRVACGHEFREVKWPE
jgi:GT2 family glycosyltransferase